MKKNLQKTLSTAFFTFIILFFSNNMSLKAQWNATTDVSTAWPGAIGILDMDYTGGKIFAVGTGLEGIYTSADEGNSWELIGESNGLPISNAFSWNQIEIMDDNTIYIGQTANLNGDIYYSTDNGDSWAVDTAGLPKSAMGSGRAHVLGLFSHNNYIFAWLDGVNNYYRKQRSDDAWVKMSWISGQANFVSDGSKLYALAGSGLVYSEDNGDNWITPSNTGAPVGGVFGLYLIDGTLYMGGVDWVNYPNTNAGIYKSTDGGENWELFGFEYTAPSIYNFVKSGNDFFANCSDWQASVLLKSADNGVTVEEISGDNTFTNTYMYSLNNTVYLISSSTIYKYGSGSSKVENIQPEISFNVYPNPCSEHVIVNNNENIDLTIRLYNETGNLVKSYSSKHSIIDLSVKLLSEGIYFMQITNAEGNAILNTQKLIIN